MGEQNLYDVTFTLLSGEKRVAEKKIRFGIKRLELKREATCGDRDQFCFYINGRYFKCLGSNIVPPDILHAGIAEKYEALVRDLKNSHTNMVRVWGGGVYLDEKFYELCDEAGIVIWQDFMLSCHSYPITDALKTALQREAEEVIKTYGAHTSLGLYCGSNETDWAFYCTGLDPNQDVYTREIFSKAVFKQDPNHIYLPSSPYFSKEYYQQYGGTFLLDLAIIEENRKALSEEHYWWHREDYRTFAYMKHNFVSEIGYSGAPSLATIRSFSGTDGEIDRKKFNYTTEGEIDYGVKYYFTDEPTSAEDFVFASQVYQAEAYKFLMEQARTRDALNGVLLWTFNEGFPSFTSGLVDYYGDKKLAWYYVKNAHEPVQTVVVERDEKLVGFVVNNTVKAVSGNVAVYDEKGERLGEYAFSVAETSAKELFSMEKGAGFLVMETRVGDKCVYNHFSVQKKYALQAYKNFMENYKNKLFGM